MSEVPDDLGDDAGRAEAGLPDAGAHDAGAQDAGAQDAGVLDAGFVDAGFVDAGVRACVTPSDCGVAPTPVRLCSAWGSSAGAWSCLSGLCVLECAIPGRGATCALEEDGPECLRCPPASPCIPSSCGGGHDFTFHVEDLVCQGPAPLAVGDRVHEYASNDGGCGIAFTVDREDGGTSHLGLLFLQSGRMLTMRSEVLGGPCLVWDAPTGAVRLVVDCPLCQVVLGP